MLFLLGIKWNLLEKAFSCVMITDWNFAVNPVEKLTEATINLCLFDESQFSNIVAVECIEINWLCKRRKKIRSQASISINFCAELSET